MNLRQCLICAGVLVLCGLGLSSAHAASLVADYRFENAASLGLDSSGLANHGTVLGTVTQVSGRNGSTQAAFFDGSTSVIRELGGLNGYDGQPGFTFAAWVNLDAATTGFDGVVSQDFGGCCLHRLLLDPGHGPYINVGAHDDRDLPANQSLSTWFHIVMTGNDVGANREGRVYINGVEVSGSPQNFNGNLINASSINTYLGTGEAGSAHLLRGALDDVQIYDGALTAAEVLTLFGTGSVGGTPIPEPATVWLVSIGVIAMGLARSRRGRKSRSDSN